MFEGNVIPPSRLIASKDLDPKLNQFSWCKGLHEVFVRKTEFMSS
jgi:hypothetical protein